MKDANAIVPRNKFDIEQAKKLSELDRNSILPLMPELLKCLQDMNWPIAPIVLDVLLKFPADIVLPVKDVLNGRDDNWKWFILNFLVSELPLDSKVQFKEYLVRLAEKPTDSESAEDLDVIANRILKTM